jgi:P27 family predicted phage terminase small subunit
MPPWLGEYARQEWDRVAPDVLHMNIARRVDSTALAAYCLAAARLRRANEIIEASSLLLREPVRKNPAVAMERDASYELKQWAREFGFTPSARSALPAAPVAVEADDAARILR